MRKAVFTLAVGKPLNLAMVARVTALPKDLQDLPLIPSAPGQYGLRFTSKLYLDKMAPADHSLFVDADCLCVGSLQPAFDAFAGRSVSVIGREISAGDWFGDIAGICRQFGVPSMPRFNGDAYYLE